MRTQPLIAVVLLAVVLAAMGTTALSAPPPTTQAAPDAISICPANVWSGPITSDTVWRADQSPYYVAGDLTIEQGMTLTIEPGVEVRFSPHDALASGVDPEKVELIVNGTLVADGEPEGLITFTSAASEPASGDWYGIRFTDSSTDWGESGCILDHTVIRYASVAVSIDAASPMISHNIISEVRGDAAEEGESAYGIHISNGSSPIVSHNVIRNILGGEGVKAGGDGVGIYVAHSTPVITGNALSAIRGNVAGYSIPPGIGIATCGGWGVGIYVADSPAFPIADNAIEDIAGAYGSIDPERECRLGVGIYLDQASPDVVRNSLANIRGGNGASPEDAGQPGGRGAGIIVIDGSAPHIGDNTIARVHGGEGGIQSTGKAPPGGPAVGIYVEGSSPVIAHNTVSGLYGGRGGDGYMRAGGGDGGIAVGIYAAGSQFPVFDNLIFDVVGGEGDPANGGGGAGGDGKGVYADDDSLLEITNNTIVRAIGGKGGSPDGADGLGIGIDASSWLGVTNNIITSHTYGMRCSSPPCPTPSHNDVWGNVINYVGLVAGPHDISADPLFVTGPDGDYYLSQVAAGQMADSPCVDTGSDTAAQLGLDGRTTRTDGVPDRSTVDLGYHYMATSPPYRWWLPLALKE